MGTYGDWGHTGRGDTHGDGGQIRETHSGTGEKHKTRYTRERGKSIGTGQIYGERGHIQDWIHTETRDRHGDTDKNLRHTKTGDTNGDRRYTRKVGTHTMTGYKHGGHTQVRKTSTGLATYGDRGQTRGRGTHAGTRDKHGTGYTRGQGTKTRTRDRLGQGTHTGTRYTYGDKGQTWD